MSDSTTQNVSPERLDQVLRALDALPTLSGVAVRILHLTAADDSSARDVVDIISADPALAARVLRLCARSDRGRSLKIASIEKAVVLMGFDAVRAACLSVQMFDLLGQDTPAAAGPDVPHFDRIVFWRHCLAAAILAERLAVLPACRGQMDRGEAFTAGLMHDLGHLALHAALPRAFDRVIGIADAQGAPIDRVSRKLIGLDTHEVARRLGERWGLPPRLVECLWLHGQHGASLPESVPTALIHVVTLADLLARQAHVAPPGQPPDDATTALQALDLQPEDAGRLTADIHQEVAHRAAGLGLDEQPTERVLTDALARANGVLARLAEDRRRTAVRVSRQADVLQRISSFHEDAAGNGSTAGVLAAIGRSVASFVQGRALTTAFKRQGDVTGLLLDLTQPTAPSQEHPLDAIEHIAAARALLQPAASVPLLHSWAPEILPPSAAVLTLARADWTALWIVDVAAPTEESTLRFLADQWTITLSYAAQLDRAGRLGEQLVQANRTLVETRDEMLRRRALASLGELTAGAAHEFNNPLMIISAKAQMLRDEAQSPGSRASLLEIINQAQKLSDMVTSMHELSRPLKLEPAPVNVPEWLQLTVAQVEHSGQVVVSVEPAAATARFDPRLLREVVLELLQNARQGDSRGKIVVAAQIDPVDGRWMLRLADNGAGLSDKALAHAFDPFFSEKPAGRRTGLGLARARRVVEAHGGELSLKNRSPRGAVATIRLPQPPPTGRSSACAA